jgi:hypothetical protein
VTKQLDVTAPGYRDPVADMSNEQGERAIRAEARRLAEQAALVIDPRLADLWQMVWARSDEPGEIPLGTLAALLRLAYALGYSDALAEDRLGVLYEELELRDAVSRSRSASRSRRGRAAPGSSGT